MSEDSPQPQAQPQESQPPSEREVREKLRAEANLREASEREAQEREHRERQDHQEHVAAFFAARLGREPHELLGVVNAVWEGRGEAVHQHLVNRPVSEGSRYTAPQLVSPEEVQEGEDSVPLSDAIESWRFSFEGALARRKAFAAWEREGDELERAAKEEARPIDIEERKAWLNRRPSDSQLEDLESLPQDECVSMLKPLLHPFVSSDPARGLTEEQVEALQATALLGDEDLEHRIKLSRFTVPSPFSDEERAKINRERTRRGKPPIPDKEVVHRVYKWEPGMERVTPETHGPGAREWSLAEIMDSARLANGMRRRFGPHTWRAVFAVFGARGPWHAIGERPGSTYDATLGGPEESFLRGAPEPSLPKQYTKQHKARR